jgi:peptidyl-dipeptidase Dcp
MTNPLLETWDTPFGLPPFDRIADADFAPAMEAALEEGRAAIRAIAENPEPATFANTVAALELADALLDRVAGVFYNLAGSDSNPAREGLQREFAPKLSAYSSEITNNAALFARIDDLWQRRAALGLTEEEERVLYLTHRSFTRSGAALEGQARARLTEVKARLAVLGTEFTQNLLADERDWFMPLSEADLEGLPGFVIDAARAAGQEKGQDGPVVTLSRSLIVPFLQFSPRRDLRERAWRAWTARGMNGGATDNRAIAAEILALREERARLLGYEVSPPTSSRPRWRATRRRCATCSCGSGSRRARRPWRMPSGWRRCCTRTGSTVRSSPGIGAIIPRNAARPSMT